MAASVAASCASSRSASATSRAPWLECAAAGGFRGCSGRRASRAGRSFRRPWWAEQVRSWRSTCSASGARGQCAPIARLTCNQERRRRRRLYRPPRRTRTRAALPAHVRGTHGGADVRRQQARRLGDGIGWEAARDCQEQAARDAGDDVRARRAGFAPCDGCGARRAVPEGAGQVTAAGVDDGRIAAPTPATAWLVRSERPHATTVSERHASIRVIVRSSHRSGWHDRPDADLIEHNSATRATPR